MELPLIGTILLTGLLSSSAVILTIFLHESYRSLHSYSEENKRSFLEKLIEVGPSLSTIYGIICLYIPEAINEVVTWIMGVWYAVSLSVLAIRFFKTL